MNSTVRHQYDAALALKAPGSAAVTADAATAAVSIYRIANGPLAGRKGVGSFDIVTQVTAVDFANATETYAFEVQVSATENGAYTTLSSTPVVSKGAKTLKVDAASLPADAAWVRLNMNVGGDTPSITYHAFVAPNTHA